MTTQDFFTYAATTLEIAIALFTVYGVCTMPRRRTSPGQLELNFTAAPMEPAAEIEATIAPMEPDPWELPATFSPLPTVAPLHTQPPHLLLLPPASVAVEPAKPKLTPKQLRDLCQRHDIKWRNAHGKNRHLSVVEMKARLAEVRAIA